MVSVCDRAIESSSSYEPVVSRREKKLGDEGKLFIANDVRIRKEDGRCVS